MENALAEKTTYQIQGYYFGEGRSVIQDTNYHYEGAGSMIDHQKIWYEEALKAGHQSGELDEAEIIQANYKSTITDEQLMAVLNDGTLMSTPFNELFPAKLDAFLLESFKSE
ncbi:hypothetical protein [Metabacillus sp. SLBN-84]